MQTFRVLAKPLILVFKQYLSSWPWVAVCWLRLPPDGMCVIDGCSGLLDSLRPRLCCHLWWDRREPASSSYESVPGDVTPRYRRFFWKVASLLVYLAKKFLGFINPRNLSWEHVSLGSVLIEIDWNKRKLSRTNSLNIVFNIILPSTTTSTFWLFSSRFLGEMCTFLIISRGRSVSFLSHSWVSHTNRIW